MMTIIFVFANSNWACHGMNCDYMYKLLLKAYLIYDKRSRRPSRRWLLIYQWRFTNEAVSRPLGGGMGESNPGRCWSSARLLFLYLWVSSHCSITPPHVFVDQFLYSTWAYTWINDQSLTILNCFFALINTCRGGGGLGGSGWSRFHICGNSFLKWNARSSHQRWNENTADALLKCNVDCIAKVLKLSDKMSHSSLPQTAKSRHPLIKSTSMDDGILSVPNIYNIQANMNLRRLVGLK